MPSIVFNLSTEQEYSYPLPPREAVIAAYAQAQGDKDSASYEKKYGKKVATIPGKGALKHHTTYNLGAFASVDKSARAAVEHAVESAGAEARSAGGSRRPPPPPAPLRGASAPRPPAGVRSGAARPGARPGPGARSQAQPRSHGSPQARQGGRGAAPAPRAGRPGARAGAGRPHTAQGPRQRPPVIDRGPRREPPPPPPRFVLLSSSRRRPEKVVTAATVMAGVKGVRAPRGEKPKVAEPGITSLFSGKKHMLLSYDTACALRMTLIPPNRKTPTYFSGAEYRQYEKEHEAILQDLAELVGIGVLAQAGAKYIVDDVEAVKHVCKRG